MSLPESSPRKQPAPEKRQAKSSSSRERIEAAALRLIALHGYEGVGLQAIADEVGLHKSTLFHHYKGKAELAHRVVDHVMLQMIERARPHLSQEPPALEDFVAFSQELVDYFASEPAAARLLLHIVLAPEGSPLQGEPREDEPFALLMVMLVNWFDRARKHGAIRFVRIRHTLMDMIGAMVFHPAAADRMRFLTGSDPHGEPERAKRKQEVAALVRRALEPCST